MDQRELAEIWHEIEKIRAELTRLWLRACQKEPAVPDLEEQKRVDLSA